MNSRLYIFITVAVILLPFLSLAQKPSNVIRGTWITNTGSDALNSKENVREAIQLCKKSGINNVYMVVWNNGETMYPSKVVESYIGVKQSKVYGKFDPLKEMVAAGHKEGIKVHAWFEFGFSYSYRDSNSVWRKLYPHWIGRDAAGNALQKNQFYWWNALHPEVQDFMNKLVLEVVNNYGVDGIQGDDRLPAMPAEGGYDSLTRALYASRHGGAAVPMQYNDSAWVQWRANQLSAYIKNLYGLVKKARPECIVSWAPNIYPWCKEHYLQDWPAWLKGGYADYIFPQLYRYNFTAYQTIADELTTQVSDAQRMKVVPGILTSLGDGYLISKTLLQQMIAYNRKLGYEGECTFYFETLRRLGKYY